MARLSFEMMSDDEQGAGGRGGTGVGLATKPETKTAKPGLYKVLMLNDDYTPMQFVVLTLQRYFKMSIEDATRVMLHDGEGIGRRRRMKLSRNRRSL
jgi:ATP-dependent Clp protease adaptor protein ClpS